MAEIREPSERYERIARDLLKSEECLAHIAASSARIAYLSSTSKRTSGGKAVCGQCERVPPKYRWCVPYDFIITVFEPNIESFDDDQVRILIMHELLHVGIDSDGDEEAYRIVPHDIEDFMAIVDRYGAGWASE